MGRLEKIVVVTVLFLVAVILGVSLNSSPETEAGSGGPLAREGAVNGGRENGGRGSGGANKSGADAGEAATANTDSNPNGLLNAMLAPGDAGASTPASGTQPVAVNSAVTKPAATTGTPAGTPAGTPGGAASNTPAAGAPLIASFLATREGLEPTAAEEWMLYTWKAGDTFKELAKRYYGSELHVARLRSANEGRDETKLAAGEKILVAAKSLTASNAGAPAGSAAAQPKSGTEAVTSAWSGGLYEVKSGDVLGTISQTVYGTSRSWKKIYDANRDVIGDNPNSLKLGTLLRIPE